MEDTSIHLFEETKTPLTLELVAAPPPREDGKDNGSNNSRPRKISVKIDRIDQDKLGNKKIRVALPSVMDTAHAGCAVDLLLDRWDSQYTMLHTLAIKGLRFSLGGVNAMTTFLGMQNVVHSIEQVILHDIIGGKILREDEDAVYTLCKTLQSATGLDTIDLSHNAVGSYIWKALGKQTKLKHLILNNVEMDDASMDGLRAQFACGDTLQSFTLSNRTRTGPAACQALDQMLRSCRNLRSFVWEQHQQPKTSSSSTRAGEKAQSQQQQQQQQQQENLPLAGLARLSKNMFKNDFHYMNHLELTGGTVPADPGTLCNALEGFHKLQFLKLSRALLNSDKIQRIVTALRSARPPLATIDFSYNQIDCEGASWVAQLSCLRAVTKNLRLLNLEHNRIAQKGALEVVESFASKSSDFNLQLEGNAFDPCQMFLSLASSKHAAETELKDLRKDCDRLRAEKKDAQNNLREMLKAQSTMINDMHELKNKAKQLEEDKQGLVKAFGVLGMMQHVEERDNILSRLAQLEEAVHGRIPQKNGIKNGKIERTRSSSPSRNNKVEPTCLSSSSTRRAPKAKSFDDVCPGPPPLTPVNSAPSIRKPPRATSFDEVDAPTHMTKTTTTTPPRTSGTGGAMKDTSLSNHTTTHTNNLTRSPRGRPGTARNLMVKAASERWKSLLHTDEIKEPERTRKSRRDKPMRSKSNKSLAEFLNRSAPDGFWENDESFALLEDDSIQTTPAAGPSSLGVARRRIRQHHGGSSRSLQRQNSSSRSLQGQQDSSSSRSLLQGQQDSSSRSLQGHVREHRISTSSSTNSSSSTTRGLPPRDESKSLPPPPIASLDKMHDSFEMDDSFKSECNGSSSQDFSRRGGHQQQQQPLFHESVPNLYYGRGRDDD